jgi:hypothetical protein
MREASDRLCRHYGLSVIQNPRHGKSRQYAEWRDEQNGEPTWRTVIKGDVDECIARAKNERQFFDNLTALGYEYKKGKDISIRPPGKERFFRLQNNFGDEYSIEGIRAQIRNPRARHKKLPMPRYRSPDFKPPKKLPHFARGSIVALYRHYLYLLGYYQQHGSSKSNARMHYLLRDDIRRLDEYIADTRLLGRKDIKSSAQLHTFKTKRETEIADLTRKRQELKTQLRALAGFGNPYTTRNNPRYQQINARLKHLRKEVVQCNRIDERSRTLLSRIERIEQDEEKKLQPTKTRKEEAKNGRDRTGDRPNAENSVRGH